jgi:6,7-dimethyl-8-ribityllumazine synthase
MLKAMKSQQARPRGGRFAIVGSQYNPRFTDALVRSARAELREAAADVEVVRVPGAFEIPVVAARLARQSPRFDAIICLGVVIRGETAHADLIGRAVTDALCRLQVEHAIPVIHEVLLLNSEDQARARCLASGHNRGREAAQTALAMAAVMRRLGPAAG